MATFNKPGVYIQETLSPNLPVATATGVSTAAFIGVADHGPVTGVAASTNVIGAPTLVSNWDEFVNKFCFGSAVNAFDNTVTSTAANPNSVGTSANDLKYAVYSFFANGGTQAYISRVVNKTAAVATANFVDQGGSVTVDTSNNTLTVVVATNSVNVSTASGTLFLTAEVGRVVRFSGVVPTTGTAATNVQALLASTNSFVITAVASTNLTLAYAGVAYSAVTQTTGTVVASGGGTKSTSSGLIVSAKDPGLWGNNIWTAVIPNSSPNYFDLVVYYSTRNDLAKVGSVASSLLESEVVERIPYLSLNAADLRYAPNVVSSNLITVADGTPSNTSSTRTPAFTSTWATASTNATSGTNGSFSWNSNGTTELIRAIRVGSTAVTTSTLAGTAGSEGATAPVLGTDILPKFDAVSGQLIFNYPNVVGSTSVQSLLTYAATRGDSFVIVDPGSAPTGTTTVVQATTAFDAVTANLNYGAAYYPNINILDPASSVVGKTRTTAPGGSIAAIYCTTDNNRGPFKSPAGIDSLITNAAPTYSLSNDDFNMVNGAQKNINIIRQIPGSGTCVMGARTIASTYSDKYIAVRRALNFIEFNLRANTQFAVFEPNDQNLWADVNAVVSGFLNDFWLAGGLAGTTAADAYYVKCDATINTSAVINAGELRIEVGVALQRPAEFVIIKIGQINGGSTVTTSI